MAEEIREFTLPDYEAFAKQVQEALRDTPHWREDYTGYAKALLESRDRVTAARRSFRVLEPLRCYLTIGTVKAGGALDFNLRYLGQSVGTVRVEKGQQPVLVVSERTAANSAEWFGYPLGAINGEDWVGPKAAAFRAFFSELSGRSDLFPQQKEHMVESALLSELEKSDGARKQIRYIRPITYANTRLHMKTPLNASQAKEERFSVSVAKPGHGGEIDLFCRRRTGRTTRLTVIELKDTNERREPFHLAIKQAIAYATFIRELVRSDAGADWMTLWGMDHQPWRQGMTINAAIAMPKGAADHLQFARQALMLRDGGAEDSIALHYITLLGKDRPRDGRDVRFDTLL